MSARTNAALPASFLLRSIGGQRPEPALGHDLVGGLGGDEVLVVGERRAAGAEGPEEDLVLLERRRLEHDAHAVGQRPLGDPRRPSPTSSRRCQAWAASSSSGRVLTVSTYAVSVLRRRRS